MDNENKKESPNLEREQTTTTEEEAPTTTTTTTSGVKKPTTLPLWPNDKMLSIRRSITQQDMRKTPEEEISPTNSTIDHHPQQVAITHHASLDAVNNLPRSQLGWLNEFSRENQTTFSLRKRVMNRSPHWIRSLGVSQKRQYRRLVFKNGDQNLSAVNIPKRGRSYLADIFTTLVDSQWRVILSLFVVAFSLSWIWFACMWQLLVVFNDDYNHLNDTNWKPCVQNVENFVSVLLFSIETQHTIGYGFRYATHHCGGSVVILMMQSCFGVIVQALMSGLVFAKLSRPKKRAQTLMFSRNAVICKRDGDLMLLFRVGDMRKAHVIQTQIRGILLKKRVTAEDEVLPMEEYHVDFGCSEGRDRLFLAWPTMVAHKITSDSPFWEMCSADLSRHQFELVIILEGIVQSTGMTTQARSSYLPSEILWGHRFKRLVTYEHANGHYHIDFEHFHATEEIKNFPKKSAKELSEMNKNCKSPLHDEYGNRLAFGLVDDNLSLTSPMIDNNYLVIPDSINNTPDGPHNNNNNDHDEIINGHQRFFSQNGEFETP